LWQKAIRCPVLLRFAQGSYVGPRKGFASFHKADTSDLAPHKAETSDLTPHKTDTSDLAPPL